MSTGSATYRLKYTGTLNEEEFKLKCAGHDFWYHSYYFDNGFVQRGDYDIGHDISNYGFPKDMSGMSVLDVGTGSGWFSTYFEQLGANVTTLDARGYCDFDVFGRPGYVPVAQEKAVPDRVLPDGREIYYSPVSRGFWIMKDILGLKAEYLNGRIYEIRPELFGGRQFDLVFLGSILMHLRDPIGAIMAARSVCRHRLIANALVAEGEGPNQLPFMELLVSDDVRINWWQPNLPCLVQWFKGAGFSKVHATNSLKVTTDSPFPGGGACNQPLCLVDAYV